MCVFAQVKAGTTITGSMLHGGLTRTYRLYIPTSYNANGPNVPLVINLHGYTSNASAQQDYSNFMPIADTAGFLMVLPQGTTDNQGQTFWNAFLNSSMVDDLGFISALIDTLAANYKVDLNRVYSTGLSNGGFMSHVLACKLNNKIAAIASVAGTFYTAQYPYVPGKAVPVMQVHGTSDPTVPYAGGSGMVSVDTTIAFWVRNNGCNAAPVHTTLPNINTLDGSTAEHYVYTGGNNYTSVELYKINYGAHTWPGSPYTIGTTNQDINASKEIWRFFSQYTLNGSTSVKTVNGKNPSFYFNNHTLYFSDNQEKEISVYNLSGVLVEKIKTDEPYYILINYENGVYLVNVSYNANYSEKQKVIIN